MPPGRRSSRPTTIALEQTRCEHFNGPHTRDAIKKYSAPFSGLAAVLAPMAGITIETRGVGRRGSATRSGIRANLAIMARFIIALMRCTAETPVPHNRAVVRDLPQPCCG